MGPVPLQDVLPVLCGDRAIGQDGTPFVPELTAEGVSSDVLAGMAEFWPGPGGAEPAVKLPELTGCVRVAGVKPGASVLAIHPTRRGPDGPLTILAAQLVGKGRCVAFTADTTWRWASSSWRAAGSKARTRGSGSSSSATWPT